METSVPLLVFALGAERCAIRADTVHEVVRAVAVATLPDAPEGVEGVINYRGRVAPVFDPRARFGLAARPLHPDQHFVMADAGHHLVALRVDRALDLLELPADTIESAERAVPGSRRTEGVGRLPDGLVVIHDLERFLSAEEDVRLDAAVRALDGSTESGETV